MKTGKTDETEQTQYLSCAETAKIVRKTLKAAFPAVKFSVRSETYSGGASIRIGWTDGPNAATVESVVKHFEGATFDPMVDLKSHHDTVLVGPNGPRVVSFGADFIFCSRRESREDELRSEALDIIRRRCELSDDGRRFGNNWVENLAGGMVRALDFAKGETLEDTFRRVVLREGA
jgi:hypothetical protein